MELMALGMYEAIHLSGDGAANVLDEAQVLVSVVNWEQEVGGVQLQEHAADAPQVCWEAPPIL